MRTTKRAWHLGAIAALVAAAPLAQSFDVDGSCTPAEQAAGECFQSASGVVVEVIPGPGGEFPAITPEGNSVFAYRITGAGLAGMDCGDSNEVSHVDISIPVCLDSPIVILASSPEGERLINGQGDQSCDFGVGDVDNDIFKWEVEVPCTEFVDVSITVAGAVPAEIVPFLLKEGSTCVEQAILGPGCGSTITRFCEGISDCPCGNDLPGQDGGCANSTGNGAIIGAAGSSSVSADDLVLTASNLPANQFVLFIAAEGQVQNPFGDGFLCVGGPGIKIIRYLPVQNSGAAGTVTIGPGLAALSCSLGPPSIACIDPGETWYWQTWYRDPGGPCSSSFNLTSALAIDFIP